MNESVLSIYLILFHVEKGMILKIQSLSVLNKSMYSFKSANYDYINSENYYSENQISVKDVAIAGLLVSAVSYALVPLINKKDKMITYFLGLKNKLVRVIKKTTHFDKTI